MRFGKIFLVCGLIMTLVYAYASTTEAQLRRRSPVLRSQTVRRGAVAKQTVPTGSQTDGQRNLATVKTAQLNPWLAPARGPSNAQGFASISYNDNDSGTLVVSGLPTGEYYAWLVFSRPPAEKRKPSSQLVAKFNVTKNGAWTETALIFGSNMWVNMNHLDQFVLTNRVDTKGARVGRQPVKGAAGTRDGPGYKEALLAGYFN
jgi:hypothetical protein